MNITIKNLKLTSSRSRETHCFTATIYVDGEVLCVADNEGCGGNDRYMPAKNSPSDWRTRLREVEVELAKENVPTYNIPNSLELIVSDLINDYAVEKAVKSLIKRRIAYTKGNKPGIYELPAKYKPTPENLAKVKTATWWHADNKMLADMSLADAVTAFRRT